MGITDPRTMSPAERAAAMSHLTLVTNWAKSVERYEHTEALEGRPLAGWKLVEKTTHRKFKNPTEAASTLRMLDLPDEVLFKTELRSPAQLEKELAKELRPVIGALSAKGQAGSVLAPLDDPRPTFNAGDASGFGPEEE